MDGAPCLLVEAHAEFAFQILDLLVNGGRSQVDLLCRLRDAFHFAEYGQAAGLTKLHGEYS